MENRCRRDKMPNPGPFEQIDVGRRERVLTDEPDFARRGWRIEVGQRREADAVRPEERGGGAFRVVDEQIGSL